jgi:hypothetical protein
MTYVLLFGETYSLESTDEVRVTRCSFRKKSFGVSLPANVEM